MSHNAWPHQRPAVPAPRPIAPHCSQESAIVHDALSKAIAQRQNIPPGYENEQRFLRHHSILERVNEAFHEHPLPEKPPHLVGSGRTIKQLIMIPFNHQPLDIMAHRVGNTIYVDQVKRPNQGNNQSSSSQQWESSGVNIRDELARTFVESSYSNVDEPTTKIWEGLSESNDEMWDLSNAVSVMNVYPSLRSSNTSLNVHETWTRPKSLTYKISTDTGSSMHVWEFSNLRMLVDHEIPVLSGENFPSISIRADQELPISILTGVDMWLDQMIKGLDGVVVIHQGKGSRKDFQLHMTSEIPTLKGSEFDPSELATVIENVHKFLDDKMTEQGHTYYLHREEGGDDLTLYDMTAMFPDLSKKTEFNPSLPVVASALMKQVADFLNDDTVCTTRIEIAYKMLRSAQEIFDEDHLPHLAASLYYLKAALYQSVTVKLKTQNLSTALERPHNQLFGLESILIERNPSMSASIPISALRSAVSIVDDDEDKGKAAIRSTVPGLDTPVDCLTYAINSLDSALKSVSIVEEREKNGVASKIPLFPIGKDDQDTVVKERKKPRPGADVLLLRSLLHLRAVSAYLLMALVEPESHPESHVFGNSDAAYLFELCRSAFKHAAEVMRLQSNSRTRTAALVQVSNVFRLYMQLLMSQTRSSTEELHEKLSEARSGDIFLKKWLSGIVIPETNPLRMLVDITPEMMTDPEELDRWMLDVGNKFRTLLTKYTKDYDQLESRLYRDNFDLPGVRCAISLALMQCGDRHRLAIYEKQKTAPIRELLDTFSSAIRFYELGLKHIEQIDGQAIGQNDLVCQVKLSLLQNVTSLRRGLALMDVDARKYGTNQDQNLREVIDSYYGLEQFINSLPDEKFSAIKSQRLTAVLTDWITCTHRAYFYYAYRPSAKIGVYRHTKEHMYIEQTEANIKKLEKFKERPSVLLDWSHCVSLLLEMIFHSFEHLFRSQLKKEIKDEQAIITARLSTVSALVEQTNIAGGVIPIYLTGLDILNVFVGNMDCEEWRTQAILLPIFIEIIALLPFAEFFQSEKRIQDYFASCTALLQRKILTALSTKVVTAEKLLKLKPIADWLIRRPTVISEANWRPDAQEWSRKLKKLWNEFASCR